MSRRKTVRAAAAPAARRGLNSGSGSRPALGSGSAVTSLQRRPAIFRIASQEKVIRLPRWALGEIQAEIERLTDLVRCLPQVREGARIGEIESKLGVSIKERGVGDVAAADAIAAAVHRRLSRIAKVIERLVQE